MVSELRFNDNQFLHSRPPLLTAEMAVASEWIVREDDRPDELLTVYVRLNVTGDLSLACSCLAGAQNQPCEHGRLVVRAIRANDEILKQLRTPSQIVPRSPVNFFAINQERTQ